MLRWWNRLAPKGLQTSLFATEKRKLGRRAKRISSRIKFIAFIFITILFLFDYRARNAFDPSFSVCDRPDMPFVVASLTTTSNRLFRRDMLRHALRSLILQRYACLEIWVFVPPDADGRSILDEAASVVLPTTRRARVPVFMFSIPHPDPGPVSKFVFALETLLPDNTTNSNGSVRWRPTSENTRALSPTAASLGHGPRGAGDIDAHLDALRSKKHPLMFICDDDRFYPRSIISSLVDMHVSMGPRSVVGARGWRIREDLKWGVDERELRMHIIYGWSISVPYRVGVVTGVNGYIIPIKALGATGKNLSDFQAVPKECALMDDIWMMGHLASAGIPRYVVPLSEDAIITSDEYSEIDRRIEKEKLKSRKEANEIVLAYFRDKWETDLWYEFGGENGPIPKPRWQQFLIKWRAQIDTALYKFNLL